MYNVFIDGREGTTGLQIYDRLMSRKDIRLLSIPEELRKDTEARKERIDRADIVFLCLPDAAAKEAVSLCQNPNTKIIDASTAHRTAEGWAYGFPELSCDFRSAVAKEKRIANPGCHASGFISLVYPLVKEGLIDPDTIIIDAKSGTSGAGRSAKVANLYCEVNENIKAYGVATHRHTPEIEEQLGYAAGYPIHINFTPHLVPMNRGILVTAYASLKKEVTYEEVKAIYDAYYGKEQFVRVLDKDVCPETKWVEGSNYVDVNFKLDPRTNRVIMMGAMDNLVKGAAGQAVQNMNLMFGFAENEGLQGVPMFP